MRAVTVPERAYQLAIERCDVEIVKLSRRADILDVCLLDAKAEALRLQAEEWRALREQLLAHRGLTGAGSRPRRVITPPEGPPIPFPHMEAE